MNELTYLTSITRSVLKSSIRCGIIFLDLGKEMNHDRCGRTAYDRRRSPYSADFRVHSQRDVQERRDKVQEDWKKLESQARGLTRVYRQARTRRQKIKPAANWLRTTKNFIVVRSSLRERAKLTRDGPRDALSVSSITNTLKSCQWLYKMQLSDRKSVLCAFSSLFQYTSAIVVRFIDMP